MNLPQNQTENKKMYWSTPYVKYAWSRNTHALHALDTFSKVENNGAKQSQALMHGSQDMGW